MQVWEYRIDRIFHGVQSKWCNQSDFFQEFDTVFNYCIICDGSHRLRSQAISMSMDRETISFRHTDARRTQMKVNEIDECCSTPPLTDDSGNLIPFDIEHILPQKHEAMVILFGYEAVHKGTCLITIDTYHDSTRTSLEVIKRTAAGSSTEPVDHDFNS